MQDKDFDSTIKNSLQNFEVPFDAASWDLLEQKMQSRKSAAGYAVTDDVDNVVKKALLGMEVAYDPANWEKMSKKIDNSHILRQRIYITKFAEAAIFLLLVWNFGSMLFTEKAKLFTPNAQSIDQTISEVKNPRVNKTPAFANQNAPAISTAITEMMAGNISIQEVLLSSLEGIAPTNTDLAGNTNEANVLLASLTTENTTSQSQLEAQNHAVRSVFGTYAFLQNLPLENVEIQRSNLAFNTVVLKKHREKKYYASNYAAVTRNRISTPYNQEGDKPAYEQWTTGYGAGIAIGKKGKKWSAETGIAYNSVTYNPQKNIKISSNNGSHGIKGTYLKEMDLDIVSVPVSANRRVARVGKSTLSAKIGATAHAITQSAFRYETVSLPPTTPVPGNGTNTFTTTQGNGVFEGGKLKNNAWASVEAGLRLERPINRQTSVFIEPTYSSVIAGKIGPTNDKIAGLVLNAGVISRL
jgi:hypothetical protein